jgi:hypothetical protein
MYHSTYTMTAIVMPQVINLCLQQVLQQVGRRVSVYIGGTVTCSCCCMLQHARWSVAVMTTS